MNSADSFLRGKICLRLKGEGKESEGRGQLHNEGKRGGRRRNPVRGWRGFSPEELRVHKEEKSLAQQKKGLFI